MIGQLHCHQLLSVSNRTVISGRINKLIFAICPNLLHELLFYLLPFCYVICFAISNLLRAVLSSVGSLLSQSFCRQLLKCNLLSVINSQPVKFVLLSSAAYYISCFVIDICCVSYLVTLSSTNRLSRCANEQCYILQQTVWSTDIKMTHQCHQRGSRSVVSKIFISFFIFCVSVWRNKTSLLQLVQNL